MTGQEILTIIEESGFSVSDFAHCNFGCPKDFELPEPLNSQRKAYYDYRKLDYSERRDTETPKYDSKAANNYWLEQTGIGPWEEVEQYGGMGKGDTWYSVKHFVDHDIYIRTDGYYQSYSGTDFYNGYGKVVTPQKKTITVFE